MRLNSLLESMLRKGLTMNYVQEFFNAHPITEPNTVRPRIVCKDGWSISVQATEYAYCTPRRDNDFHYLDVECGYPSSAEDLLMPYAEETDYPTNTVYGYVPIQIINGIIEKHGGIA